jgi:hypothetical protein
MLAASILFPTRFRNLAAELACLWRGPAEGYGIDDGFAVVEHPALPADQRLFAIHRWVDPGYFAAIGIPILRGHTFDWNQQLGHATEVIITESFARRYSNCKIGRYINT